MKKSAGLRYMESYFLDKKGNLWVVAEYNLAAELHKLTREFKDHGWGLKIPFAFNSSGWHFCLSFDEDTFGKIIINRWTDHSPEEQFIVIADSFEEFINGLQRNPEEEI